MRAMRPLALVRRPLALVALALLLASSAAALSSPGAEAAPRLSRAAAAQAGKAGKAGKVRPGAARVAIGVSGMLRTVEPRGRRAEPLTLEEDTARRIEELLRGPLRVGTTAIYVADARTGQPVFAVHPDDALNPASNVKLLSTATALEILGPEFRYQTRVIGSVPDRNVVRGDVYLLGSYDPTLGGAAMEQLAAELAAAGVARIEGDGVVSDSPTRDAVYRALLPVEIIAPLAPGLPPTVTVPVGYDFVVPKITATTVAAKKARRARLTYAEKATVAESGQERLELTIGGTISAGKTFTHWLWVRDRGRHSAHLLRAALAAQGVAIAGDVRKAELSTYLFDRIRTGDLPVVLARHQSASLAEIVSSVNKRSINWLADRVIMTAAALKYHELPSMARAVDAMYDWLSRRLSVGKDQVLVDTGSGLSRQTQLSARHITEVLRVAGGFSDHQEHDPLHRLWLDSLAFADGSVRDGTLRGRFRTGLVGRLRGKTGTLSTSIALSGVLEADPERPLVFSIVTNGASALPKGRVRAGHERIIALLGQYLSKRSGSAVPASAIAGASLPAGPAGAAVRKPVVREAPEELGLEGKAPEAAEASETGEGGEGVGGDPVEEVDSLDDAGTKGAGRSR
jgi:serine-type D-Ala-D-Ala carboxypeptidase/endopeptidase (penicillin-binding protein 4)